MSTSYPHRQRAPPHRLQDEQQAYQILSHMRQQERDFRYSLLLDSDDEDDENDESGSTTHMMMDDDEEEVEDVIGGEEEEKEERWESTVQPLNIHPFASPSHRPSPIPRQIRSISDFFHLIIPPSFIRHIVSETNHHAAQEKENRPPLVGRWKDQEKGEEGWMDTDEREIEAFIGVIVMMGVLKLKYLSDYWNQVMDIGFVASHFSRHRFIDSWLWMVSSPAFLYSVIYYLSVCMLLAHFDPIVNNFHQICLKRWKKRIEEILCFDSQVSLLLQAGWMGNRSMYCHHIAVHSIYPQSTDTLTSTQQLNQ